MNLIFIAMLLEYNEELSASDVNGSEIKAKDVIEITKEAQLGNALRTLEHNNYDIVIITLTLGLSRLNLLPGGGYMPLSVPGRSREPLVSSPLFVDVFLKMCTCLLFYILSGNV